MKLPHCEDGDERYVLMANKLVTICGVLHHSLTDITPSEVCFNYSRQTGSRLTF